MQPRSKTNDIDWDLINDIDQETLKDIGIGSAGHRLKILKAAGNLHSDQAVATSTASKPTSPSSTIDSGTTDDISSWSRTPGERKPVTMLFADIVDSTAITEQLDAEDAHDLLYRATQCMCKAVEDNKVRFAVLWATVSWPCSVRRLQANGTH